MKKILLEADTVNGVSEKITATVNCENEKEFFTSLKTLDDDEKIVCAVSEKMYKKIKEIYGISR